MSEVTYNEEVTAETLNDIAVDLGVTEFSYFEDNVPYAVNQLNQITADLVSPGVLRTLGNVSMGCEVITSGDKAYVDGGVIVFESGAKIRITKPVEVNLIAETYIYALNDPTTGRASLEVSEAAPSGDYVLLAEVDADGVIADRRTACVAKVMLTADTPNTYTEVRAVLKDISYSDGSYTNNKITVNMGTNAYSYIMLVGGERVYNGETLSIVLKDPNPFLSEDGVQKRIGVYINGITQTIYVTRNGQYQEIEIIGGEGVYAKGTYTLDLMVM